MNTLFLWRVLTSKTLRWPMKIQFWSQFRKCTMMPRVWELLRLLSITELLKDTYLWDYYLVSETSAGLYHLDLKERESSRTLAPNGFSRNGALVFGGELWGIHSYLRPIHQGINSQWACIWEPKDFFVYWCFGDVNSKLLATMVIINSPIVFRGTLFQNETSI